MNGGSTDTDNPENSRLLLTDCIHTTCNNIHVPQGSTITSDIDAFSFVIIVDSMNDEIKSAL